MKDYEQLLERSTAEVIDKKHLQKRLEAGDKLRVKLGIDPTSPDIHLGFAVVLWRLQAWQQAGHKIVLIIGDATAQVGDPTGKNTTRPVLKSKEVADNARTYIAQIGKILDLKKTEVHYNSEWFSRFSLADFIKLLSQFTAAQVLERDDFAKRLKDGSDIHLHELIYPLMQAYDSVMIKAEVEFGGTDQRFNILAGRELQKKMGLKPQDMIVVPLLVGTDGTKKMSKSLGNYIGITEAPEEMYGKIMSIPDELMIDYWQLTTLVPSEVIETIAKELTDGLTNPRDIKMQLAREIVTIYHGQAAATDAEEAFVAQFQKGKEPTKIKERRLKNSYKTAILVLLDTGEVASASEARRLIDQGGVRIDSRVITNPLSPIRLKKGVVIQIGKRRFLKVK